MSTSRLAPPISRVVLAVLLSAVAILVSRQADAIAATQSGALRIVVVAGEDAVNIIQQKTAVAPIVEVRDRNDNPVAGAIVLFTLRGSRVATFAQNAATLRATTDATGRATATGFTPTASGAVRIQVDATSQGQTATVTISQTNVMTAAQAAAIAGNAGVAGAGVAAGVAGAGVAAAAGGGMSGVMIGAIAAAIGGGAIVAAKAAGGSDNGSSTSSSPATPIATPAPPTAPTPAPTPSPAPTPPPTRTPFEIEWTFEFGANLTAIAQCPQYAGPPGPNVGPFAFGGRGNPDGTFSWVFSVLTPAAQAIGRFTQNDVTATISCLGGGGPTGNLSATGTLPDYRGTWTWGNQSGVLVVRPQ